METTIIIIIIDPLRETIRIVYDAETRFYRNEIYSILERRGEERERGSHNALTKKKEPISRAPCGGPPRYI